MRCASLACPNDRAVPPRRHSRGRGSRLLEAGRQAELQSLLADVTEPWLAPEWMTQATAFARSFSMPFVARSYSAVSRRLLATTRAPMRTARRFPGVSDERRLTCDFSCLECARLCILTTAIHPRAPVPPRCCKGRFPRIDPAVPRARSATQSIRTCCVSSSMKESGVPGSSP